MSICPTCNVLLNELPDVKYVGKIPVCPRGHDSKRVHSFWLLFGLGILASFAFLLAGSMNPFGMSRTGATLLWLLPFAFLFGGALLEGIKFYRQPEPTRKLARGAFGICLGMLLPLGVGIVTYLLKSST